MEIEPIATGRIRFRAAVEGGRRSGAPNGPTYAATAEPDSGPEDADLPRQVADSSRQVSIVLWFRGDVSDGWRAVDVGFIAPHLVQADLVPSSRWLVNEGARVLAELQISGLVPESTDEIRA